MWLEAGLANLPAKNRQLVAEHENLQLLRPLMTAKERRARANGRRPGRRPTQAKATSSRRDRRR